MTQPERVLRKGHGIRTHRLGLFIFWKEWLTGKERG